MRFTRFHLKGEPVIMIENTKIGGLALFGFSQTTIVSRVSNDDYSMENLTSSTAGKISFFCHLIFRFKEG